MSVFEVHTDELADEDMEMSGVALVNPFARSELYAPEPGTAKAMAPVETTTTPFLEALAPLGEDELEAEAVATLAAELEDEEFVEALEVLADQVAARHLRDLDSWTSRSEGFHRAAEDAEQWMEGIIAEADHLLAELEASFGERSLDAITDEEIDAALAYGGDPDAGEGLLAAQELFFGKLVKKVKKGLKAAKNAVKKGVKAVGGMLSGRRIVALFRKAVPHLLRHVLNRAVGRLPTALRPIARKLARRYLREAELEGEEQAAPDYDAMAEAFDATLAESILTPDDAAAMDMIDELNSGAGEAVHDPIAELDAARQQLTVQLAEADDDHVPFDEMEQFIPAVMAAMPAIKVGMRVLGLRKPLVKTLAKPIAELVQKVTGRRMARTLAPHIADAGLRLLGLEAEHDPDGMLGAEAVVAAVEDTVREALILPPASLEQEHLLEAVVQEAFTAAAVRHLPAVVLRPEVVAAEQEDEGGVWVPMPRLGQPLGPGAAARPHYRYKKFSLVRPVQITRPLARSVMYAEGDTLEDRLLDAGETSWPVHGELHVYELLPGGELGHLAAHEADGDDDVVAEAALEFEELAPSRPLPFPHPRRQRGGRRRRGRRTAGGRVYRLKVRGRRLQRRPRFSIRLDLAGAKPQVRLHLLLSERAAHTIAKLVDQRKDTQVVSNIRRLVGPPMQRAMTVRLDQMLGKRGITVAPGSTTRLATGLTEAAVRTVAAQLRDAAPTLASAAKDPARGATLTFAYAFADRDAVGRGDVGEPSLRIRAGRHRD